MYSTHVWAISSFRLVFTRSHLHSMKAAQTVAKRIMLSSPQHTLCRGKSIPMVLHFSSDISRHLLTYKEPLLQYWQVGFPEGPSMFVLFYVRSELVAVVYRRALWSWVSFYQQDTPAVKCLSSANCQSKISIKIKKKTCILSIVCTAKEWSWIAWWWRSLNLSAVTSMISLSHYLLSSSPGRFDLKLQFVLGSPVQELWHFP